MKGGDILCNISPQSILFTGQYLMNLIYRRGLIIGHRLPLMIAVIVFLVIPDVLILFLLTFLRLVFREEPELCIDFPSELIDKFLHLILVSIQTFQHDLPAALHFVHLYR
jgi:hypothetical protein